MRASGSYAVHLINANNAFVARYLLDRGLLGGEAGAAGPDEA